jgi:hypothetical protein
MPYSNFFKNLKLSGKETNYRTGFRMVSFEIKFFLCSVSPFTGHADVFFGKNGPYSSNNIKKAQNEHLNVIFLI